MNNQRFFNQSENNDNAFLKINITNLVDIALTLVVILLMISPFIEQGFSVKLPKSGPNKMALEKSIILTITKNNEVFIGNKSVNLSELKNALEKEAKTNPNSGVVIKGEKNISYQDLINVLDIVKSSHIKKVGLATEINKNNE
ncbi:MAG: biopolymer transporter ExbD [Candidatus Omnitrophica bacterium]|nr:biopolymer transporter ExbD [Candidatus Omnitrophota bacterium]